MNVLLGQIMNNKIQKDKKKPTSTSKVVVVQSLSHVQLFETPRTAARQASLSLTNSPEFAKVRVHCIGDAISFTRVDFFFFYKRTKKVLFCL